MFRSVQLLAAILPAVLGFYTALAQDDGWKAGRATFYGNSCGFGYIYGEESPSGGGGTGWDVAALSDSRGDFAGSCGRCYEVKCDPSNFQDGYGNELTRDSVCYDTEASVIVRTVDTCPCNYEGNAYSNTRWCCGDGERCKCPDVLTIMYTDHYQYLVLPLAVMGVTPKPLTGTKWGVMGLQYRSVACGSVPAKEAPAVDYPFPGEDPPPGSVLTDRWGGLEGAPAADVYEQPDPATTITSVSETWGDASWSAYVQQSDDSPDGKATCASIEPGGALAYMGQEGDFDGKLVLDMWVDTSEGVPDVDTYLAGNGSTCSKVPLQDLSSSQSDGKWSKYNVYLGLYDSQAKDRVVSFADAFTGCGGLDVTQLNKIEFRNDRPNKQRVCVGGARLIAE